MSNVHAIRRGVALAHLVLADDADPTPAHGIERPLLNCRAEFVGTPERIVNEFMRPWLGAITSVTTEPVEP